MQELGIGIIGGGYMGKAHAVAYAAVGAVFNTRLRPRLEMVAASSLASAEKYRDSFGFARAAQNWEELVRDPKVEAIVIASPQSTHRAAAELAFDQLVNAPVDRLSMLGLSVERAERTADKLTVTVVGDVPSYLHALVDVPGDSA